MIQRAAITLLVATACLAQDAARMDQVVQSFVSDKTFMGTVLVARGDEILLSKGYGSANLEWSIPNSPSTRFRLGSVTKQFTGAAILLLEERGKLTTGDPIRKFLPDAPAAWDRITIFHLLTHTAGIPNFTGFPDYRAHIATAATPAQLVERFRDKPLDFQPGERMSYSNSGYVLLGVVIEKASGVSYEKFLQDNIFTPLGMKDSGYDSNSAVISRRAAGYSPSKEGPVNAPFIHMTIPFSAGALYSTTEDLLRWQRGLFGGKVLSAAALAKMIAPAKNNYACGVTVRTVNGRKLIDHGGGIEGFNTMLAYYPEDKLTVVALANLSGNSPQRIATDLAAVAQGRKVVLPSERKEVSVAPAVLGSYVGVYTLNPKLSVTITAEGGQLTSQVSGQGQAPLFASSETRFFFKIVDAEVEFFKDEKGAVTHLILYQGGREMKAPRSSDKVTARKEIAVPAAILAKYAGVYELRPGFDLAITLEGEQLISQATGQGKVPLFAETETKFFPKVMDATIEFLKDDKGAVTHLMLRQGPAEIKAARK